MPPTLTPTGQPDPTAPPLDPAQLAQMAVAAATPPPVPASAGFAAWAADPRNSAPVANSIVKPGQPLLPPNAPQVGMEAQAQPTHGPADPEVTQKPRQPQPGLDAAATSAAGSSPPQPALTPPSSTPTGAAPSLPSFDQWAQANPHLVQQQHLSAHPVLGALTAALLGAGGGLHGDVGAGANWAAAQHQQDREILDANLGRYKASVIAPAQAQSVLDKNAATTNYTNAKEGIAEDRIAATDRATQQRASAAATNAHIKEISKGVREITNDDGSTSLRIDRESPFYDKLRADTIEKDAKARNENVNAELKPRQVNQADKRLGLMSQGLGLRAQSLQLRKNDQQANFYGRGPDGQVLANAPEYEDDDGNVVVGGLKGAGTAIKQQNAVGTFRDLGGAIKRTQSVLADLHASGGSLADPRVIYALKSAEGNHGVISTAIGSDLIKQGMTPEQINAVSGLAQFQEQLGTLRAASKGTASEAQTERMLAAAPVAGDTPEIANRKMQDVQATYDRLAPSITRIGGGQSLQGKGGHSRASVQAPARSGGGGNVAPEGTVIQMSDGSRQVKRGGKWVKQ